MIHCYKVRNNVWAFIDVEKWGDKYKGNVTINLHGAGEITSDERFNIEMLEKSIKCDSPEEVIKLFREYFKGEQND